VATADDFSISQLLNAKKKKKKIKLNPSSGKYLFVLLIPLLCNFYLFIYLLVDVYCFTALFGPLVMCHGCRKAEEDEKYNSNTKFNEDNHLIFRQARQQHINLT